jgi:hypothetical protein
VHWFTIFAVFLVCHLTGDFLLQTEWQAVNKMNGLGADPEHRRALVSHVVSYTAAFLPAFVWIGFHRGAWVVLVAALVMVPHGIQDDRRLLARYIREVKHSRPEQPSELLLIMVDQSFHIVQLFGVALLAAAL